MTTLEVLKKALALIKDKKNWCQGTYRRNGKLCASGAIIVASRGQDVSFGTETVIETRAANALADAVNSTVPSWNDTHTHAEVVAGFKKAIAMCRKRQRRKSR